MSKPSLSKEELIASLFPWQHRLSEGIDRPAFAASFLVQPDLFLRIRPGKEKTVYQKLAEAGIDYYPAGNNGIGLPNSTPVEAVLEINREVVVQDRSSQQTGELVRRAFDYWNGSLPDGSAGGVDETRLPGKPAPRSSADPGLFDRRNSLLSDGGADRGDEAKHQGKNAPFENEGSSNRKNHPGSKAKDSFYEVWDCCAASGGKSMMAYDLVGERAHLTVSDVRGAILQNLAGRLEQAGIPVYHSFMADLAGPGENLPTASFDLVIADVPCTGSGTWARVPEQLYFFTPEKIGHYRQLQQKIVSAVIPKVKAGGAFLYITCSAFLDENEEMVRFILDQFGLTLLHKRLIKGYEHKADTLFAALFIKC